MFLKAWRVWKAAWVRWNSARWAATLRLMGARVGRGVVFGGRVSFKFNGDPRRIRIGDGVTFQGDIDLRNRENGAIVIEAGCSFDKDLRLVAARESTIRLGRRTQVGMSLVINAGADVALGEDCLISSFVHINGSGHPTARNRPIAEQGYIQKPVRIGNDVWLANCVNVLMGTVIEDGVIVAANSVVSGHFPSYSLVLGNPARVMGRRGDSAEPPTAAPAPRATAAAVPRDVPATAAEIAREIENLLVRLRVLKTPPPPTARLRGEGYVDSLNWALFFEGLTERFGDALTLEEFLSPAMDSVESIAQRLHQRRTTGAPAPRPAPHGLHERLVELARQKPDLEILRLRPEGGGEVRFTYAGLLDAAARWAGAMRAAGFGPGDRVGLLMPLSEDLIVAFVGCLRLGAVPSVFSYPSAKVPLSVYARHHKDMFSRVELKGLFTTDDLGKLLRSEVGATLPIAGVPAWRTAAPSAAASPAGLDDTALIQHSSGTTGIQKGVALTPRAVSVQIDLYARALRLNERDVIVSWLPLYHDMGLVACFLLPLLTGTPLVLLSPFEWVARPGLLFETLAESGGTLVWMPNFAFQLLADRVPPSALHALDLTRVRAWISCSEVVSASTAKDFWETFAESGVDEDKLWSCYAMAENVFAVTQSPRLKILSIDGLLLQKEDRVVPKDGGRPVVSQGVPLPGVDIRVLGRDGAPCPEGRHGEIALRGPCLMSGYYRNPEKTREALRDGWFVTGDLGFLWEGELYVTGRKKDLVIVAGRNFYPQDIEAAAARIPGTKAGRCAAFGCPNPRRGTEDLVIVAERSAPDVDAAAWEAAVKKIVFEELDCPVAEGRLVDPGWVIKTSSGKINRSECRRKYLEENAGGA